MQYDLTAIKKAIGWGHSNMTAGLSSVKDTNGRPSDQLRPNNGILFMADLDAL